MMCFSIALNQKAIGHQYSRQQLSSKRINWLFSIGGGNSNAEILNSYLYSATPVFRE
jgi:hypothetical protein